MTHGSPTPLRASVAADFRGSGWARRLALLGVVFWLLYEWGPGNESVTPWLVFRVVGAHDDRGWPVVLVAAGIGFGFTFVQQLLSGVTALVGFSMFGRTAHASWRRLSADGSKSISDWEDTALPARAVVAFTLGTTAVALIQIMITGQVGARRHLRVVVSSAFLTASIVAVIAAVVGALAAIGRSVPALDGATDGVLRVLGNPLLWVGLVVVTAVVEYVRRRRVNGAGSVAR